jgi:hypothetical protein
MGSSSGSGGNGNSQESSRDQAMGMGGKTAGGTSTSNNDNERDQFDYEGQAYGTPDSISNLDRPNISDISGPTLPGSFGPVDPDPEQDVPTSQREDTITNFQDNLSANIRSNPYSVLAPVSTLTKTALQTAVARNMMGLTNTGFSNDDDTSGGKGENELTQQQTNELISLAPFLLSNTVAPESQVNKFFADNQQSTKPISQKLENDYNSAKTRINGILGIIPTNQQFGYSTQPSGGFTATNLASNPFYIEFLKTRGLI